MRWQHTAHGAWATMLVALPHTAHTAHALVVVIPLAHHTALDAWRSSPATLSLISIHTHATTPPNLLLLLLLSQPW